MRKVEFEEFLAPSAAWFNTLMLRAQNAKVKGAWAGSVFLCHPVGVIRRGIIFCNLRNTSDECYADVILDPTSKIILGMNDPAAFGNPFPKPEIGGMLRIYQNARWCEVDGPWRRTVHEALRVVEAECDAYDAGEEARKLAAVEAARLERLELLQRAADAIEAFAKQEKSE